MFRTRDVINSLPLLAAVLGRNYGVKVHIGGSEAKTNGKVIFSLPCRWTAKRNCWLLPVVSSTTRRRTFGTVISPYWKPPILMR
ncbi:MAG: hypothetical protein IJU37_10640 [Desulfovibrio sp.]|nr:hypothetical protein [Desulfovibrio sp.]